MSPKKIQATKGGPCADAPGGDTDQAAAIGTRRAAADATKAAFGRKRLLLTRGRPHLRREERRAQRKAAAAEKKKMIRSSCR